MLQRSVLEHHEKANDFNDLYSIMREDYRRSSFAYGRKKIEDVLRQSLAEIPDGGRVLDIGCGTGEQLHFCHDLGFEAIGLEPASNMRAIAQENNPDLSIYDGIATKLPFANDQFDFVLAIEVLRYLYQEDIEQAYREMIRVTKPGGRIFLVMVNRYSLDGFYIYNALHGFIKRVLGRESPIQCSFTTPAEIQSALQKLSITQVRCYGRFFGLFRVFYKIHAAAGVRIMKLIEIGDDYISRQSWSVPFAGHLIVIANLDK